MSFNRNQSDFVSGQPAAAHWTLTLPGRAPQTVAWQGAAVYSRFKSQMNQDIPSLGWGSTITREDLVALRDWLLNPPGFGRQVQRVAGELISDAINQNRMTPGAARVIIALATEGNFQWVEVPSNARFPALGTPPDRQVTGALLQPAMWEQGTIPPANVPTETAASGDDGSGGGSGGRSGGGSGGGSSNRQPANPPQQSPGVSGWVIALAVGIPVVLAIVVGVAVYFGRKNSAKQLGSGREPSMRETKAAMQRRMDAHP